MQLTFNLTFTPAASRKRIQNTTWLDAGWATACLGYTKKVEVSQSLSDALQHGDDDDHDQQIYDTLWLAHHHLALSQRPSLSFTFDFLRDDRLCGRLVEHSLRLHVEENDHLILLGLLQDFSTQSNPQPKEKSHAELV
jgi:hypothetical protein